MDQDRRETDNAVMHSADPRDYQTLPQPLAVMAGEDTGQIAARHGTSKRRVQHLIEFAFLAPDIVTLILEGRQPVTLTSEVLLRDGIPSDWAEQRRRLLAVT